MEKCLTQQEVATIGGITYSGNQAKRLCTESVAEILNCTVVTSIYSTRAVTASRIAKAVSSPTYSVTVTFTKSGYKYTITKIVITNTNSVAGDVSVKAYITGGTGITAKETVISNAIYINANGSYTINNPTNCDFYITAETNLYGEFGVQVSWDNGSATARRTFSGSPISAGTMSS